jgi:hypothetical protein
LAGAAAGAKGDFGSRTEPHQREPADFDERGAEPHRRSHDDLAVPLQRQAVRRREGIDDRADIRTAAAERRVRIERRASGLAGRRAANAHIDVDAATIADMRADADPLTAADMHAGAHPAAIAADLDPDIDAAAEEPADLAGDLDLPIAGRRVRDDRLEKEQAR